MALLDHTTNACPVSPDTYVRVEYRKPGHFISPGVFLPARLFMWKTDGSSPSDIIKYEVKDV